MHVEDAARLLVTGLRVGCEGLADGIRSVKTGMKPEQVGFVERIDSAFDGEPTDHLCGQVGSHVAVKQAYEKPTLFGHPRQDVVAAATQIANGSGITRVQLAGAISAKVGGTDGLCAEHQAWMCWIARCRTFSWPL